MKLVSDVHDYKKNACTCVKLWMAYKKTGKRNWETKIYFISVEKDILVIKIILFCLGLKIYGRSVVYMFS